MVWQLGGWHAFAAVAAQLPTFERAHGHQGEGRALFGRFPLEQTDDLLGTKSPTCEPVRHRHSTRLRTRRVNCLTRLIVV